LNGPAQGRVLAVSPINAPLMGLRIVNTQSQTFNVTGGVSVSNSSRLA
jgi:hypothetical protein